MTTTELAKAVLDAVSACPEFKQAAQDYIDAVGTDGEKKAAEILIAEAEEDICSIDNIIKFFSGEMAVKIFGEAIAADKLAHMKQAKADGAIYCDCPGCSAAKAIIDNKDLF